MILIVLSSCNVAEKDKQDNQLNDESQIVSHKESRDDFFLNKKNIVLDKWDGFVLQSQSKDFTQKEWIQLIHDPIDIEFQDNNGLGLLISKTPRYLVQYNLSDLQHKKMLNRQIISQSFYILPDIFNWSNLNLTYIGNDISILIDKTQNLFFVINQGDLKDNFNLKIEHAIQFEDGALKGIKILGGYIFEKNKHAFVCIDSENTVYIVDIQSLQLVEEIEMPEWKTNSLQLIKNEPYLWQVNTEKQIFRKYSLDNESKIKTYNLYNVPIQGKIQKIIFKNPNIYLLTNKKSNNTLYHSGLESISWTQIS